MVEERDKPDVLFVDLLAEDRGHLIDDDLFLAACLLPIAGEFCVVTSPTSAANIRRHLEVTVRETQPANSRTHWIRLRSYRLALSLRCAGFQHVVFQSFERVSALLFTVLHPDVHVHLIVTNNLRSSTFDRRPMLKRFILRMLFQRVASIVVHCQYEVAKIRQLVPNIDPEKIFIKPFHQMAFSRVQLSWQEKLRTILFLGPERAHKKVEPIVDMIKRDKERRYRYVFCAMRNNMAPETQGFLEAQENVELSFGYVAKDEYYRLFSEAALVILTHDEDFEGALSGAFCDAIASGTPVIGRDMAPHDEFFERFGPMGFLVDYSDPEWCAHLLKVDLGSYYERFQQSMARCRESCSTEAIRKVFQAMLARSEPTINIVNKQSS